MRLSFFSLLLCGLFLGCQEEEPEDPDVEIREVLSEGGGFLVSFAPNPDPIPPIEMFSVEFLIQDAETGESGENLEEVTLEVSMPEHEHGMNVEPILTDLGGGLWEASPLKFHMTGNWSLVLGFSVAGNGDQAVFEVHCCETPE